jgi:hypothetical protein
VVGREGEDAVVGRSGGGGTQGEEFEAAQALTEAVGDEHEGWVANFQCGAVLQADDLSDGGEDRGVVAVRAGEGDGGGGGGLRQLRRVAGRAPGGGGGGSALPRKGVGEWGRLRGRGGGEWRPFQLNVLLDADGPSWPFRSKTIRPVVDKSLPILNPTMSYIS